MTYEKKVAKALKKFWPAIILGQWFEFYDYNGHGFAQADAILLLQDKCVVFESKYTQCATGYTQITDLYRPLVEFVWKRPVVGVQVCKILTTPPVIDDPRAAICAPAGTLLTWHFLGR
jgi:hypothetical protein